MRATWWREASGAVADLGVLLPIALALIVVNGLSVTAVIVPAGLAYVMVAVVYRVPVAVQPLKAFGAIAIATGAGPDVIAAGALLMGLVFFTLGAFGALARVAAVIPLAVIRGVQGSVGITLCVIAWRLLADPPSTFVSPLAFAPAVAIAAAILAVLVFARRWTALAVVVVAVGVAIVVSGPLGSVAELGPTALHFPHLDWASVSLAATALVLPQVPVTLTNSCVAPADAARRYFGREGMRVSPDRLAVTLGAANLGIGAVSGMPICHGAGGMSAHHFFGARSWRAPALIGGALIVSGLLLARPLAEILPAFPLPALAALLAAAGIAHLRLLADLRGRRAWGIAALVTAAGLAGYLVLGVVLGALLEWWMSRRAAGRCAAPSEGARDSLEDPVRVGEGAW